MLVPRLKDAEAFWRALWRAVGCSAFSETLSRRWRLDGGGRRTLPRPAPSHAYEDSGLFEAEPLLVAGDVEGWQVNA